MQKESFDLWNAAREVRWDIVQQTLNKYPETNVNATPTEGKFKGRSVLGSVKK